MMMMMMMMYNDDSSCYALEVAIQIVVHVVAAV